MPKDLESFLADCIGLRKPWEICGVEGPSESADGNIHVRIRVPPSVRLPCPGCGRMCACYDHSRERVWRSTDISATYTYLHAEIPRTDCRTCGQLSVPVPWAGPGSRFKLVE